MSDFNSDMISHDDVSVPQEGAQGTGVYVIPKSLLVSMIAVLGVVLIVLIVFLFRLLQPGGAGVDAAPVMGIKAEMLILGPKKGDKPYFSTPMGAAWSPSGNRIYIADSGNDRICVFDKRGRFVKEWGGRGMAKPLPGVTPTWHQGQLNYPTDVATDRRGNVYVADFYNDSISVFDRDGGFVRRFPDPQAKVGKGSSGQGGRGIAVTALTVSGDKIYATDTYQIFVFTLDGRLVQQFGQPGSGPGELDHPNGIAVGRDGTIFVSDSNNNRVAAYDGTGKLLWVLGKPVPALKEKTTDTDLVLPRGLSAMSDGSLLVADPLGQQLALIDTSGKLKETFGRMGSMPGELNFPNDVAVNSGKILVADRQNNRVQVVQLVKQ